MGRSQSSYLYGTLNILSWFEVNPLGLICLAITELIHFNWLMTEIFFGGFFNKKMPIFPSQITFLFVGFCQRLTKKKASVTFQVLFLTIWNLLENRQQQS